MSNPSPQSSPRALQAAVASSLSLDDTIEHYIGHFGPKQLFQSIIISLAWSFDAHQTFITLFTDALPQWTYKYSSHSPINDICKLPLDSWSWDLPPHSSTVSEWSLQCTGPVIRALPASAFLGGSIIGGFLLGSLADFSLGGKKLLVLSCLIMSLSSALTAISNNIWTYSGFRFISGFGRSAIGGCAMVLAGELVGKKWRDKVGIIGFFCFSLGFLSLPILNIFLRGHSWRLTYLITSIPCIIYALIVYLFVHESPRWLFIQGRLDKFVKTIKSLSTKDLITGNLNLSQAENVEQKDIVRSSLKVLVMKKWAVQRLLTVMTVSLGIGMTYYGMPLGLGNLNLNLCLTATVNAVSEIPASLMSFLLVGKVNRKGSIIGLCLASGICGIGSVLVSKWKGIQLGFELGAFFGACTAYDIIMIYTLELFPTCVRNSAVSAARQALVLGGTISPVLAAVAAESRNEWLCYGVFGALILVTGLSVVWLPETRGSMLADTMDEEEQKRGSRGDPEIQIP